MLTISTINRVVTLAQSVTGMHHEAFQTEDGSWHYGWGFPGCLYEYQTNDSDDAEGFGSEHEAWSALAEDALENLRSYDRETLAEILS